ncbi:TM2 domain-containing protein [Lutibacter sp. Hel_I_33_5]|uniref:TM2 domain-containing protein n=1 Tax=Lutibacter sp. Hel_I_33_5 TaxID=1566289 RepID=UPI00119D4694|nr:TM2 domain-containing protein [Lutibacter sp. Hel_I_33_5]TVZ54846.1 TM2 domain-containing protein [Lutibacter sp. Hel_I_33_5]
MKKSLTIYTLLFAFLAFSFNANASFPVKKKKEKTEIVNGEKIETTSFSTAFASSGKSQVTALLLCLFLGGIGIHRFYLGYTWQGIVQILTLGGLGIWALIDLVRIITGDLQPKNGSYSKTL